MLHHEQAINRYVERMSDRPEVLGVLVTGSVSTATERADSDIDLVLVVDEEEWSAAVAESRVMVVERDDVGYENGYFDVKLATVAILQAVPDRGDDPVRHSLSSARCVLDKGIGLDGLVTSIRAAGRASGAGAESFLAQAAVHGGYFLAEGLRKQDPLLAAHAAVHLAVAACRAALATTGVRFPDTKDLVATVRALPLPTAELMAAIEEVVLRPSVAAGDRVLKELQQLTGRSLSEDQALSRFVLDNELAWFTGVPAPEYR